MRHIVFIFLLIAFISCQAKDPLKRLGKYEYPLDSLYMKMVFVYINDEATAYAFHHREKVEEGLYEVFFALADKGKENHIGSNVIHFCDELVGGSNHAN